VQFSFTNQDEDRDVELRSVSCCLHLPKRGEVEAWCDFLENGHEDLKGGYGGGLWRWRVIMLHAGLGIANEVSFGLCVRSGFWRIRSEGDEK
jgi:hypothetical protein